MFCRTSCCLNGLKINQNFTHTKWWNSCIGAQLAVYLCLILCLKMTSTNSRYSCIVALPTYYLCLICAQNFTGAKWWNSCVCLRHAVYLWRIKASNMTFNYSRKSWFGSRPREDLFWIWARNMTRAVMKFVYFWLAMQPTYLECGPQTWLVPT